MPYCYACRNSKPATHSHFVDYGALALRPPKRHISEIEALWARMSEEQRAQALDIGRRILAAKAGEEGETAPRRTASSSPRSVPRAPRPQSSAQEAQEEGEGAGAGAGGIVAALAVGGLFLGGIIYSAWKAAHTPPTPPQGPQGPQGPQSPPAPPLDMRPASDIINDMLRNDPRYRGYFQQPDTGPQGT